MGSRRLITWCVLGLSIFFMGACHSSENKAKAPVEQVLLQPMPTLPDLGNFLPQVQQQLKAAYTQLKNESGDAQALGTASQLLHAHHLEIIATPGYQRAIKASPEDYRWHYLLGVAAKAVGQDELAGDAFRKAHRLAPEHAASAIELAELELQQGRFAEAKAVYDDILAKNANHVMALYGLGQVALAQGEHQQAAAYLNQVLELDPAATMVYYPLSQAQAGLGKTEAAQVSLSKRADGRPSMPDELMEHVLSMEITVQGFRRLGDQALRAGDYAAALAQYELALNLDERDPATYLNRGWAYFYSQDGEAAARDWSKVIELTEKPLFQAHAHFNLAQLSRAINQVEQAIAGYQKALELYPEYQGAKLALADVLRSTGQFEKALKHYQALVVENPGDPVVRLGRSLCLIRTAAYPQAVKSLQEDIAAQPQQATFYHMLIRLLAAAPNDPLRNGPEALNMMVRLTDNWQVLDSGLAETAAMVLAEIGRFDEAIRMQQRALTLARQEGEGDHLKQRLLANLKDYANKTPCRLPWPDDAPLFTRPSLRPEPVLQDDAAQP